jgi:hypothetical protein
VGDGAAHTPTLFNLLKFRLDQIPKFWLQLGVQRTTPPEGDTVPHTPLPPRNGAGFWRIDIRRWMVCLQSEFALVVVWIFIKTSD